MQKKIFILKLFTILLLIGLASAQLDNTENQIKEGTKNLEEQIQGIQNNITDLKNKSNGEFLADEWTNFIRTNKAFSWIYKINPLFKFFIGQEFSISWKFTIGLLIWLIILFTILGSLDTLFENKIFFVMPVSFVMSGLISQLAVPFFLDKIVNLIKKTAEKAAPWVNLGTILILICLIVIIRKITKEIKKKMAKRNLEKRVKRAEEATSAIDSALTKAEGVKKGMEEEVQRTTKDEF